MTKTRSLALATALTLTLGVGIGAGTGAASAATSVATPAATSATSTSFVAPNGYTYDFANATTNDPKAAAALAKVRAALPSDWRSRQAAVAKRLKVEPSSAREALERAIDPTQYQCSPTALDAYVDQILSGIDYSNLFFLATTGALDVPTYDSLLFGSPTDPRYALPAAYRNELTSAFRKAQGFWDIDGSNIQLMAMHGDVLRDQARLTRTLAVMYEVPESQVAGLAQAIGEVVASDPGLQKGANPIFTLNAFAFSAEGDPDPVVAGVPDKLIFGDGILAALEAIGVGDVGPRAVLGHEYGHHVQYDKDLFNSPLTGPEATRRTELMADAFGTYFVTHKRGLALNSARVLQAERSFYAVGDCSFTSAGHHGTPNQRLKASTWGFSVADSAQKQGHILPSLTLDAQFEAKLPEFVAPDA
ncbi:hypothetical protein [Terrabacter sp. NPDC080008]|uniref:hypothetical protein n=1 Tax=Terrabacter sp. NPDC080008 TaxID=3155176 RepID=UPI00344C2820